LSLKHFVAVAGICEFLEDATATAAVSVVSYTAVWFYNGQHSSWAYSWAQWATSVSAYSHWPSRWAAVWL